MRRLPVSLCFPVAAAAASLSACDLFYPEVTDDRLVMIVPLNPDWAKHLVRLAPVSAAAEPPAATVRMYRRDPREEEVSWTLVATATEPESCPWWGSNYWATNEVAFCLDPGAPLDPGAAYMVEASAEGYRTARGHTLVVGDFEVEKAVLTRTGGSARLDASWTGSVGTHRYFVSLRRRSTRNEDPKGWYAEVDGTSATVSVPEYAIDQAIDPLILDVAALSEEFHAYVTSGTGGTRFSVPPVQNIENGFGFVGAMRVRSLTMESR